MRTLPAVLLLACGCAHADFFNTATDPELQVRIDEFANRPLVVGLADDHIPFSYYSDSYQTHVGYAVSMARALCADMGASCSYRYMGSYELVHALLMGRVNFTVAAFSPDPMFQAFTFSRPMLKSHPVIVTPDFGLNFASSTDLSPYNVGVCFGTPELAVVAQERINSHIAYYTIYSSYAEMFAALEQGKVDILYMDNLTAYGFIKRRNLMLYVCADKFNNSNANSYMSMMISKQDPALLYRINLSLDRLKAQGRLHHLSLEYFQYLDTGF